MLEFTVGGTANQHPSVDVPVDFGVIRCFYYNCTEPQAISLDEQERPDTIPKYSEAESWGSEESGAAAGWWDINGALGSGTPDNTAVRVEIYEGKLGLEIVTYTRDKYI